MPNLLAALAFVFALALALHAEAEGLAADLLQKAWQEGTVRANVRLGAPFAAEGLPRDDVAVEHSGATSVTSERVFSQASRALGIG
jgi:hypothetical protein